MEDCSIVELYWQRNENAIAETEKKYGKMLKSISFSLLRNDSDAEECVNDTYLAAWNSMPESKPEHLGAFLAKITRRISIDSFRKAHAEKRNCDILSELDECISSNESAESICEIHFIGEKINEFLLKQKKEKRIIFLKRYFYGEEIKEISEFFGKSEGSIRTILSRIRSDLKNYLRKENLL